jgi:hypothetical protein
MTPPVVAVPSLDELASNPSVATALPRPVAAALLPSALTVVGILFSRLHDTPEPGAPASHPANSDEPEYLSAADVTRRFGLSRDWLEHHARDLRGRGIIAKPSRKVCLYNVRKLRRFVEAHTATS